MEVYTTKEIESAVRGLLEQQASGVYVMPNGSVLPVKYTEDQVKDVLLNLFQELASVRYGLKDTSVV